MIIDKLTNGQKQVVSHKEGLTILKSKEFKNNAAGALPFKDGSIVRTEKDATKFFQFGKSQEKGSNTVYIHLTECNDKGKPVRGGVSRYQYVSSQVLEVEPALDTPYRVSTNGQFITALEEA